MCLFCTSPGAGYTRGIRKFCEVWSGELIGVWKRPQTKLSWSVNDATVFNHQFGINSFGRFSMDQWTMCSHIEFEKKSETEMRESVPVIRRSSCYRAAAKHRKRFYLTKRQTLNFHIIHSDDTHLVSYMEVCMKSESRNEEIVPRWPHPRSHCPFLQIATLSRQMTKEFCRIRLVGLRSGFNSPCEKLRGLSTSTTLG